LQATCALPRVKPLVQTELHAVARKISRRPAPFKLGAPSAPIKREEPSSIEREAGTLPQKKNSIIIVLRTSFVWGLPHTTMNFKFSAHTHQLLHRNGTTICSANVIAAVMATGRWAHGAILEPHLATSHRGSSSVHATHRPKSIARSYLQYSYIRCKLAGADQSYGGMHIVWCT